MLLETICTSARSLKTMGSHGRTFFPPGAQGNRALQLWDSRREMESEHLCMRIFVYLSINMHSIRLNRCICIFFHRILTCTLNALHEHASIINISIINISMHLNHQYLSHISVESICALIWQTFCEEIYHAAPTSCAEGSFAAV